MLHQRSRCLVSVIPTTTSPLLKFGTRANATSCLLFNIIANVGIIVVVDHFSGYIHGHGIVGMRKRAWSLCVALDRGGTFWDTS